LSRQTAIRRVSRVTGAAKHEMRALNLQGDRLALENDRLQRRLKARDDEVACLSKALDAKHNSLERLRASIGRWSGADGSGSPRAPAGGSKR
jgi:hypothetical protein